MLLVGIIFASQFFIGTANALNLSEDIRTIPLNEDGETITFSNREVQMGSTLFVDSCAQCHLQGKTKTNPNIGLSIDALAKAIPARDNLLGLIDYIQNPTSYDGEEDISLYHLNTGRPDLWPEIRSYTQEDVKAVAGYILVQTNADPRWGKRSLIEP